MVNEALYPLEFEKFKEEFINMRVENDIAAGGDGVQVRIDVTDAFNQGWRPPHGLDMWIRARKYMKRVVAVEVQTSSGPFWQPLVVNSDLFRVTKGEVEDVAFDEGFRLE